MRIAEFTAFLVRLPLRREVKHASAARRESDNLVVRCRLRDGTEGWGEGVPRPYVTGETPETALERFGATPLAEQLSADCTSWNDVFALVERLAPPSTSDDPRGCGNNALRCAVELSLLDAYARLFNAPMSDVVKNFAPAATVYVPCERVRYSAAITAASARKERRNAILFRLYGFAQCKVKVGGAGDDDVARLRRIRFWLGPRVDLRIDVNEAWPADAWRERLEPLRRFDLSCVEQPIAHADIGALNGCRGRSPVPIMLDESLTSLIDAEAALNNATCDLFNGRLSKCGGFLNSLRLAAFAKQHGFGLQLGCHPGESGILSAAGRHWASSVGDIRYLEGSYDRHLLKHPLTREDLTFGRGGFAPALTRPGLGVSIDLDALRRATLQEASRQLG